MPLPMRWVSGKSAAATNAYLTMFNGGTITANAVANASGTYGTAEASATGYRGSVTGGGTLNANIVNAGTMNVSATAIAPETASAHAVGIWLANAPTGGAGNALNGYVTNSGTLNVVASASGGFGQLRNRDWHPHEQRHQQPDHHQLWCDQC